MKASLQRAIANVVAFGDTDIFPFPDEIRALKEDVPGAINICEALHKNIDESLSNNPPTFYDSFVPNGYTGFRWATQIDTFLNIYLLGLVIELGEQIEAARLPTQFAAVHSYRFLAGTGPELWDRKFGWKSFYDRTRSFTEDHKYIVVCDVSEFYRRIYHHRLENALKHVSSGDIPSRIMKILTVFSRQTSYGLPIGGPASRLLAELVLNQIDHLIWAAGYKFARFADDYVIAAKDKASAYDALLFISEKLQINQGLALQRAKTRILTSAEYKSSRPLVLDEDDSTTDLVVMEKNRLFNLNIFYDPYSITAAIDYESLKSELDQLDILFLLNHEIRKSRIHVPTINRIVQALRHTRQAITDEAVMTIVTNLEAFYPCLSAVLITLNQLHDHVSDKVQTAVVAAIASHLANDSYLLRTEACRSYAVRLVSRSSDDAVEPLLMTMHHAGGPIVRREVLSALTRRNQWMVISDLRHEFNRMSPAERRAMIVASYKLVDEGQHWRKSVSKSFDPFEKYVQAWMQKASGGTP